jgi:hypothetical protein
LRVFETSLSLHIKTASENSLSVASRVNDSQPVSQSDSRLESKQPTTSLTDSFPSPIPPYFLKKITSEKYFILWHPTVGEE